jgi:hypothetical protein
MNSISTVKNIVISSAIGAVAGRLAKSDAPRKRARGQWRIRLVVTSGESSIVMSASSSPKARAAADTTAVATGSHLKAVS